MGLNQCNFIGNLCSDPETKMVGQKNTAMTKFRIAVNSGYGENQETEYINVVTWGKTAEACSRYISKGSQVFVSGALKTKSYEGNSGEKKYFTEVVAFNVQFLGGSKGNGSQESGGRQNRTSGPERNSSSRKEEDVPF